MAQATKTIHIEPGSELDRVLAEAAETGAELERGGVRYRVTLAEAEPRESQVKLADERDIWGGYDPARVLEALRRSAGSLVGVDREQLLQDLAEQREQDNPRLPS